MNNLQRQHVAEILADMLPMPDRDCAECDPGGGCPNPTRCLLDLAENILDVVEREQLMVGRATLMMLGDAT